MNRLIQSSLRPPAQDREEKSELLSKKRVRTETKSRTLLQTQGLKDEGSTEERCRESAVILTSGVSFYKNIISLSSWSWFEECQDMRITEEEEEEEEEEERRMKRRKERIRDEETEGGGEKDKEEEGKDQGRGNRRRRGEKDVGEEGKDQGSGEKDEEEEGKDQG
ncbi:Hypothetical predicted protein [Xyrichtys novacula]|uniref:Uncharacterized protein n=1 Tax=Xyrichtys novacula TaxID=13765 RepID=A0AAV1EHS2_XYRNO|nr:Hypothetical predicted protein [Xyrichtys novacula]